jgi:hypothetical protein
MSLREKWTKSYSLSLDDGGEMVISESKEGDYVTLHLKSKESHVASVEMLHDEWKSLMEMEWRVKISKPEPAMPPLEAVANE